ncbi:MAG: HD domain-containing protein, partial [Desulfovibrio sp.]|nr:HD domain-containing protein [Desulfovibrio sp.]
ASKRFARVEAMVQTTTEFLKNPEALKSIAAYVSRGYSEYHHSLGVMVFALSLAQTYEQFDDDTLTRLGLGAIFHDIGKIRLPQFIFAKKPSERTPQEVAMACSHPTMGVVVAGSLPLHQLTIQCILFHHEMENGQGYPSGITGEDIPLPVKILSLCNVYENLTRATAEGPAKTPFEALSWLKERRDRFDVDVIRRLIMVLSKADIT